jgi:3-hydroxybutyryl-CoA dehydrogenase
MAIHDHIKTVGVVGAGTMGQGIIQVLAQHGFSVLAYDAMDGAVLKAIERIDKFLARSVDKGKLDIGAKTATLERIQPCGSIGDFEGADFAIEAATERIEIKEKIFHDLDRVVPSDRILASNTSSISVDRLANFTQRPERFIGMHFFNPVPLMSLVEVITGSKTTADTTTMVMELASAVGKTPLECKDSPGFISNRVGMLMVNEAAFCLHEGIAEPAAIDGIMKLGFNHPMGPLALADLIGVDVCLFIMEVLHRDFGDDKYRPCPMLKTMVADGHLGKKSGRGFYDYG